MLTLALSGQTTQPLPENLVPNGDFEQSGENDRYVTGWQPLRYGFDRLETGESRGHVIQFTLPDQVARSDGFQFFSSRFPIQEDQIYRCQADVFTDGPNVVLFLNGYAQIDGKERRVYRKQIRSHRKAKSGSWETLDFRFTPRQPSSMDRRLARTGQKTPTEVEKLEVEFFMYGVDGGVVQIDDVRITRVDSGSETKPASRTINQGR